MKRFDRIKTLQLAVLVLLAGAGLFVIVTDPELYAMIAANSHVRHLAVLLWILLGISFVFLLYDFNSWSDLKRENLELDNAIYSDALTGIANRYSVDVYIGQYRNRPLPRDMGCVTLELTNLTAINASMGHGGGDAAIREFAEILQSAASGVCFIGRNGGNKFLAIFRECSRNRLNRFLQSVEMQVKEQNAAHPEAAIAYRSGAAFDEGEAADSLAGLVALSDRRAGQADGE